MLIIGILAAVALPQYNKAVDKSRTSELSLLTKAAADPQKIYELTHGAPTHDWTELDFDLPAATLSTKFNANDTLKKGNIEEQIMSNTSTGSAYSVFFKILPSTYDLSLTLLT